MKFEGEMTEGKFIDMFIQKEAVKADAFEVHPKAVMAAISGRDVTHFDNFDKALGLTRSDELTYESICAKVKPIDEARDKIAMESGFLLAFADFAARRKARNNSLAIEEECEDEEKVEEMKKRRSTIVHCEQLMRDFSASSIESTEKVRMRRKSLIKTGKITEDIIDVGERGGRR